jgi:predicted nucleic acid-binding protein
MLTKPPLVLDNTLITRFGICKRFDILESLYSGNIIVPTEVIAEAFRTPSLEKSLKRALTTGWIEEHKITYHDYPKQVEIFARLTKRYGPGESAVMAIAQDLGCTVGSDDLSATVAYCKKEQIPLLGTYGVLYDAYKQQKINDREGTSLLQEMVHRFNQKLPVTSFKKVIEWFEHKKGLELF